MRRDSQKTGAQLRRFGLVMAMALATLGGLVLWRGQAWGSWLFWLSGTFIVLGVVVPKSLGPVERSWMTFGKVMGAIMCFFTTSRAIAYDSPVIDLEKI